MRLDLKAILIGASIMAGPALAQGETISMLPGDDPKVIAYAPCEPSEEAGECISHVLSCTSNELYGDGLELMVIGQGGGPGSQPDTVAMARALLDNKRYGEAKLRFMVGGAPAEVTAHFVLLTGNELNGDWDLTVRTMDQGGLLDVLTIGAAAQITADVGGFQVQLANSEADAEVIMKFKQACSQ